MAFWDRLFNKRVGEVPMSDSQAAYILGRMGAGLVNEEQLYGLPAFYACVKVLAETFASLSVGVYRQLPNGDIEEVLDHPLTRILKVEPADAYSSFTFRETEMMHLCVQGNAYAKIKRTVRSATVKELEIIAPNRVSVYSKDNKVAYRVDNIPIDSNDLLHIPALATDGFVGLAPITVARKTFLLSLSARDYAVNFFQKGTFPSGIVKNKKTLTDKALKRLAKSFKEAYSGQDNIGNVIFLEEDADFMTISLNPIDAAYIDIAKLQLDDIARIYRIPQHMVGDLSRSTNNNIEQQSIDFTVHTMRPWVKRWENELNRKLFTRNESDMFIRFNMDSLLRGDSTARANFYSKMFMIGAMNPNEIRNLENLNAREGGDEYFVPTSMMPNSNLNDGNTGNTDNKTT